MYEGDVLTPRARAQLASQLAALQLRASILEVARIAEECGAAIRLLCRKYRVGTVRDAKAELLSWGIPERAADFICERLPFRVLWRFAEMIQS